ncbi:hypothetical protein MMA96_25750, partial [Salmonella enterica]|nr:hypothetical protein [Salmonella enterica]
GAQGLAKLGFHVAFNDGSGGWRAIVPRRNIWRRFFGAIPVSPPPTRSDMKIPLLILIESAHDFLPVIEDRGFRCILATTP